jgi:hypothetical protein
MYELSMVPYHDSYIMSTVCCVDDTGIGAAICHHNWIIWFVNMTEPGEQQYYMLLLIDKKFKELPDLFMVSFLHDLTC